MDKKNIIILCLCLALAVVSWIAFKQEPIKTDNTLIEKRVSTLDSENVQLKKDFEAERKKSSLFVSKIDSLQNLKPQIKYVYEKKSKHIDSASVSSTVSDFNNIFSNEGIK